MNADLIKRLKELELQAFEDDLILSLQHDLLARIAAAVHGAPPSGMCWPYHDLPELVAAMAKAAQPKDKS